MQMFQLKECMSEASEGFSSGKICRVDAEIVNYPVVIWMNKAKKCGIKS